MLELRITLPDEQAQELLAIAARYDWTVQELVEDMVAQEIVEERHLEEGHECPDCNPIPSNAG